MILDDIAAALIAAVPPLGQKTASSTDWFIYEGYMQEAPDRAICIYQAGGRPPETGQPVDYPTIQIKVRGQANDYQAVQAQEAAIYKLLHATAAPILLGSAYVYCYAVQSGPLSLGQDTNRRPMLARNYRVMQVRS